MVVIRHLPPLLESALVLGFKVKLRTRCFALGATAALPVLALLPARAWSHPPGAGQTPVSKSATGFLEPFVPSTSSPSAQGGVHTRTRLFYATSPFFLPPYRPFSNPASIANRVDVEGLTQQKLAFGNFQIHASSLWIDYWHNPNASQWRGQVKFPLTLDVGDTHSLTAQPFVRTALIDSLWLYNTIGAGLFGVWHALSEGESQWSYSAGTTVYAENYSYRFVQGNSSTHFRFELGYGWESPQLHFWIGPQLEHVQAPSHPYPGFGVTTFNYSHNSLGMMSTMQIPWGAWTWTAHLHIHGILYDNAVTYLSTSGSVRSVVPHFISAEFTPKLERALGSFGHVGLSAHVLLWEGTPTDSSYFLASYSNVTVGLEWRFFLHSLREDTGH